ncbi:hypothetical protein PXH67_47075 (plasmid) [Streptomyces sp. P8-A8]|uniref:hypothetical protein n=1 Tax=Streptomyces sp. P8-A8 TaxID=3029759 RepID=UPI0036D79F63
MGNPDGGGDAPGRDGQHQDPGEDDLPRMRLARRPAPRIRLALAPDRRGDLHAVAHQGEPEHGLHATEDHHQRHRLPAAFLKPRWVRRRKDGAIHIRTGRLAPGAGTAPLADTVRSFATRHDVPVTATHDDS